MMKNVIVFVWHKISSDFIMPVQRNVTLARPDIGELYMLFLTPGILFSITLGHIINGHFLVSQERTVFLSLVASANFTQKFTFSKKKRYNFVTELDN